MWHVKVLWVAGVEGMEYGSCSVREVYDVEKESRTREGIISHAC